MLPKHDPLHDLLSMKVGRQTIELRRDPLGFLVNVFDGHGYTIIALNPAQAADLRDGLAYMLGE